MSSLTASLDSSEQFIRPRVQDIDSELRGYEFVATEYSHLIRD